MTAHEIGGWILQYLVNSLWQLPLLAAAGWMVSRVVRRLGPGMQHRVWVATLVLSVLAPLGGLRQNMARVQVALDSASASAAYAPAAPASISGAWSALHLTALVYWALLFGYAAFLLCAGLRLALAYKKTRDLGRNSTAAELPEAAAELWQECRRVFAVGGARLRCSAGVPGPVTIGGRRPCLLLSAGFLSSSTREDLAAALGHECAHLERRDFVLNFLYEAAALPVAFHPAIWIVKSRIAETRELICDQMAAARIAGSRTYAQSLLRIARAVYASAGAAPPYAIGMFDSNSLENRIVHLMQTLPSTGRRKKFVLSAIAVLMLSASGIAAFAFSVSVAPAGGAQSAQPPIGKVYEAGETTAPELIHYADPEFSDQARRAKYQGVCMVSLVVDAQGNPQQVRVIRPLGMGLDEKAVEAVERYKFKPAMRNGKPVPAKVNIEVNFRIY